MSYPSSTESGGNVLLPTNSMVDGLSLAVKGGALKASSTSDSDRTISRFLLGYFGMSDVKTVGKNEKSGTTVKIDRNTCISAASCVAIAPGTFQLDGEEGKVMIVDPNTTDVQQIIDAAKSCPVNTITIIDSAGKQIWPPV